MAARKRTHPVRVDEGHRPLARLKIENFRGIGSIDLRLDERMTVLLGVNGSGKTSVVEALASLAPGDREGLATFPIRRGKGDRPEPRGRVEVYLEGHRRPAAVWDFRNEKGDARQRLSPNVRLFAYGRYRRVLLPDDAPPERSSADLLEVLARRANRDTTTTLNRPDGGLLEDVGRYISALNDFRHLANYAAILDALTATLRDDEAPRSSRTAASPVTAGIGVGDLRFRAERDGAATARFERNGVALRVAELSDGYQAMLVVVADLVLRLAALDPTAARPTEVPAIVLIDEVDLHLHVRWQRRVLRQLTSLFPNVQWIVTTHAPAVVQAAIDEGYGVVQLRPGKAGPSFADPVDDVERAELLGASLETITERFDLFAAPSRWSPRLQRHEEKVRTLSSKVADGTATPVERRLLLKTLDLLQQYVAKDDERQRGASLLAAMTSARNAFIKELAAASGPKPTARRKRRR